MRLFRREGRMLSLSAEGETLLNYSVRLLRLADQVVNELRTGKPHGTFRLGFPGEYGWKSPSPHPVPLPRRESRGDRGTRDTLVNRGMNFEIEAAFVSEPFTAPELEALPVFHEELVLITPREIQEVRTAKDLGRTTKIAFAQGCYYRKRLEDWLGAGSVMPERALEFASYQGMIACVAAGTGFAIVPKSVLLTLQATEKVNQYPLPKRVSTNRTHLVWRGQPSLALESLLNLLRTQEAPGMDVEALMET